MSPSIARLRAALPLLRKVGLTLALLLCTALFLRVVHASYPIQKWLFWVYLRAWAGALFFATASLCAGTFLLRRLLGKTLPLLEQLSISFGLGVFVFYLLVFTAGIFGVLHPVTFFVLPLVPIAVGGKETFVFWRRAARHARALPKSLRETPSLLRLVVLSAGIIAVIAMYLPILTPDSVGYDVKWYHLPLAENYVAQGAIRARPEGWLPGAYPHLVSHLYTWALLAPAARYFDHVALCSHIEFVIFLFTLPAVTALARRVLPRPKIRHAWVAMFVFPEIFAYDSCLTAGADHVAALWAPLLFATMLGLIRTRRVGFGVALALFMAATVCTKYTAISVVLFPAVATGAWLLYRLLRPASGSARRDYVRIAMVMAAAGLVASAPHWLKNWLWYGDPFYPTLHRVLSVHPWTPDFLAPFQNWFYPKDYRPPPGVAGFVATLKALFTYSFVPNDWWQFHRDVPIFGSLATLSLVCLPFLRGTRRIWLLQLAIHSALFVWYSLHHFDRYLQTILPWMATAVSVTAVLLWRQGVAVKLAASTLVTAQLVWGGDVYFFGGAPIRQTMDLLASGFRGNLVGRFEAPFKPFTDVSKDLPKKARVLVHENHVHWGLQRASVSDWQGTQAGISYGRLGSLPAMYDLLHDLGVTHLYWDTKSSKGYDTLAGDLTFFTFAKWVARKPRNIGAQTVAEMPRGRPKQDFENTRVLFMGCTNTYQNGIFPLTRLVTSDLDPKKPYPAPDVVLAREPTEDELKAAMKSSALAVVDPGCYPKLEKTVTDHHFEKIASRGRVVLYAKPPTNPDGSRP